MKKWLFISALSTSLFAAEGESSLNMARINKGNWSLSGSGGAGFGGSTVSASADLSAMYYIMDKIALGIDTSLNYYSGMHYFSGLIGPSLQYNFFDNKVLTAYTKLSYLTEVTDPNIHLLRGDIGVDFLLNKTLSIGPFLRNTYYPSYSSTIYSNLGGRLGIHF